MKKGKYFDNWRKLLSCKRLYALEDGTLKLRIAPNEKDPSADRSPFERDYERILFSPGFRRMAGKTQVQPFAEIDFIHNRLTHSIEVAAVCHSLAKKVFHYLLQKKDVIPKDKESFVWATKAAGIAHDIGNPPYGHAGESAIRSWAEFKNECIEPNASSWYDVTLFDGNAQGFHLLSRHDPRPNSYYHFTCASLGAVVKYPWTSKTARRERKDKFDVFLIDEEAFKLVWAELGLVKENKYLRHPLSFLSEAADDICYRILDFEDAVVSNIVQEKDVRKILLIGLDPCDCELVKKEKKGLQWIRGKLIGKLIAVFSDEFIKNYDKIMEGTFKKKDLKSCLSKRSGVGKMLSELDKKYDDLFSERHKVLHEIGGYYQIPKMLDAYWSLLKTMYVNKDRTVPVFAKLPPKAKELVRLAWEEDYYENNRGKGFDWWFHAVIDFIAGMTDWYLRKLALNIG